MIAGAIPASALDGAAGTPLRAEHYLYSRARHDARVAAAERAVKVAHARLRRAVVARETERARCERLAKERP